MTKRKDECIHLGASAVTTRLQRLRDRWGCATNLQLMYRVGWAAAAHAAGVAAGPPNGGGGLEDGR